MRRVRAGYVGPLRAPVCCRWLGRASDILVLCGGDESDGALEVFVIHLCAIELMYVLQKQNFLRDQSGMKKQLSTLQQLLQVMDPELYRHFEKTEGLNLFFCFRYDFSVLRCLVDLFIKVWAVGYLSRSSASFRSRMSCVCGRFCGRTTTRMEWCSLSHSPY